jgi:hypothetical protein
MTEWTPKLEGLIREMGEIETRNAEDMTNPDLSIFGSAARVTLRTFIKSMPIISKLRSELQLPKIDQVTDDLLIELAKENGSDAVDKLKAVVAFREEVKETVPSEWNRVKKIMQGLNAYKQVDFSLSQIDMTDFKAQDFPLYQHLVELDDNAGVERAKADFEAACKGGEVEKYQFALGIQTIAANVPVGDIPGVTEDMNKATLRSCLDVFKAVAKGTSEVAANAKIMVNDFEARGLGL